MIYSGTLDSYTIGQQRSAAQRNGAQMILFKRKAGRQPDLRKGLRALLLAGSVGRRPHTPLENFRWGVHNIPAAQTICYGGAKTQKGVGMKRSRDPRPFSLRFRHFAWTVRWLFSRGRPDNGLYGNSVKTADGHDLYILSRKPPAGRPGNGVSPVVSNASENPSTAPEKTSREVLRITSQCEGPKGLHHRKGSGEVVSAYRAGELSDQAAESMANAVQSCM